MLDILVYLFENYTEFSEYTEADGLTRALVECGFEAGEIASALDWLARLRSLPMPASAGCGARVFSASEYERFGPACLGFLMFLEQAGGIDAPLRELILAEAEAVLEAPVALEAFKGVVLMVLWSRAARMDPLIVGELLADAACQPLPH
jgi:Smg protein